MKGFLAFFLALSILALRSYANEYEVNFYTRHQGLPQDYVYTLMQDYKDYLWIGTGNGLTRFDGKNFLHFKQNSGQKDDFITASCLYPDGKRVFSHFNGGFSLLFNGNFSSFAEKSPSTSSINTLFLDHELNLWAGSKEGELIAFDKDHRFRKEWHLGEYESVLFIDSLSKERLIVCTDNRLILFGKNVVRGDYVLQTLTLPNESSIKKMSKLSVSSWLILSDLNELFVLDADGKSLQLTPLRLPIRVTPIFAGSPGKNRFWIMEAEGDWHEFKVLAGEAIHVSHVKDKELSSQIVPNLLMEDKEGNIWIGTFGNGLIKFSLKRSTAYPLPFSKGAKVTSILTTKSGTFLLSSTMGALEWSQGNKKFSKLQGEIANKGIISVCELEEDHYLVATTESKVYKWHKPSNKWELWPLPISDQDKITQVLVDSQKNVWVATSSGAILFEKDRSKFKILTMEDGLAHNYVYAIFCDSRGRIWLGTHKSGLSYYEGKKIHTLKSPLENAGLDASCFIEDSEGSVWIGTSGQGILIADNQGNFVGGINSNNGLVSDYVYFLQKDLSGTIWVGHKNGLSRVLKGNTGYLISDYTQYLGKEELTQATYSMTPVNDIWIGGQDVCIRLNVNPENKIPEGSFVDISDLKLNYDQIDWSKRKNVTYHNEIPDELTFGHNENLLTFNFNGITYSFNDKLRYQYKLEGFDDKWSLLTEQNFVTYNKLPPGSYTFLVKARNYAGLWSPAPTALRFMIKPPYWETWWFRTIFVISILVFVYTVIKVRTANLKRRNEALEIEKVKLEKEVKERKLAESRLLKSELNLKTTNQELNTLIYRASHDLRGPVSTISGLVNVANIRVQDPESISFFSMINTSVQKLDQILKKLFLVSEIKQSDLQPETFNVAKAIQNVLNLLADEIEQKQVEVHLEVDASCTFYLDAKLFETIVKNVLDNTLIYGRKNDSVVKIQAWVEDRCLRLHIWDNGKGIKAEHIGKVFDMFYKASDLSKGNGLGLYIVKKAIILMNGDIQINSVENEFTEVDMLIPEHQAI